MEDGNKPDKNASSDHFEGLDVTENSCEDQSAYIKVKMRSKAEGERINSNIPILRIIKRNNRKH